MRLCLALLSLCACGNGAQIGSGDIADTLTTIEVLRNPAYVELNPTIPNDPVAGAAVLMAQKYLAKAALIELGVEPTDANRVVDAGGWLAACHNVAFFAGSGHPVGLLAGAGCAYIYWEYSEEHKHD